MDKVPMYTCDNCNEIIYEEDRYYRLTQTLLMCEECVENCKETA